MHRALLQARVAVGGQSLWSQLSRCIGALLSCAGLLQTAPARATPFLLPSPACSEKGCQRMTSSTAASYPTPVRKVVTDSPMLWATLASQNC